ncbi:hypothetical protein Peur_004763 [Populus x canadensis]
MPWKKLLTRPYAIFLRSCSIFLGGVEDVLPLECQIPSLRSAIQEGLSNKDNVCLHLEKLEALNENFFETQQQLECY